MNLQMPMAGDDVCGSLRKLIFPTDGCIDGIAVITGLAERNQEVVASDKRMKTDV